MRFKVYSEDELLKNISEKIVNQKVIGWFQGRFEWGPRSLGNRSILADPRNSNMKDIVNIKIKFREPFRPFAPSVLSNQVNNYFDVPTSSTGQLEKFMLSVVPVRKKKFSEIAAVNHMGTARIQTVFEESNPLYYGLIQNFFEMTGTPMLLNTSFNIRGEPIVNTPEDAIKTFLNSGIDTLVLGYFVIDK